MCELKSSVPVAKSTALLWKFALRPRTGLPLPTARTPPNEIPRPYVPILVTQHLILYLFVDAFVSPKGYAESKPGAVSRLKYRDSTSIRYSYWLFFGAGHVGAARNVYRGPIRQFQVFQVNWIENYRCIRIGCKFQQEG